MLYHRFTLPLFAHLCRASQMLVLNDNTLALVLLHTSLITMCSVLVKKNAPKKFWWSSGNLLPLLQTLDLQCCLSWLIPYDHLNSGGERYGMDALSLVKWDAKHRIYFYPNVTSAKMDVSNVAVI